MTDSKVPQVTRNNHFVPQAYLRRWADESECVYRYRLLVSHKQVPLWTKTAVRGLASRPHLYTLLEDDEDVDAFERWFEQEFETPAQDAIDKAVSGARLRRPDWERLVLYCLAQDLRTPRTYHRVTSLFGDKLGGVLEDVAQRLKRDAEAGVLPSRVAAAANSQPDSMADVMRVSIDPDAYPERDEGQIAVRALAGRRLWLNEVKRLISGQVRSVALGHEWSIVEPAEGSTWVTSDHPVVRLNYYGSDGTYDLDGGWGRRNGNIVMPLSPRHMLYTQVGDRRPRRFTFNRDLTALFRKVQVESALDDVFADSPSRDVVAFRRRTVDADVFTQREKAWATWHEEQNRAESEFRAT